MKSTIVRTVLLCLLAGLSSGYALSQTPWHPRAKVAKLRLRIIPDKQTYSVGQLISVRTEFANISGKTLCFPVPAQNAQVPASGYLIASVISPRDTPGQETFIEVFDGGITWPLDKLLQEIKERWISLAPNAVYLSESAPIQTELSLPGQWEVHVTYHPPEGSFRPVESREYLTSAARTVGCTVPQSEVYAEPISFSVVAQVDSK